MKNILINGNFLCRNLTGVERFAWEVCNILDTLITDMDTISILVPANAKIIPYYKNIKIIPSKKKIKSFPFWDMINFANEVKKGNFISLNFGNTAPIGNSSGISFIHDIYAYDCPKDFSTFRDRLIRFYSLFQYRNICKNALKIITVSEFSKNRIQEIYHVENSRISIIGNGWEHFDKLQEDDRIFSNFQNLKKNNYYFTLGSLSKRKNLAWILEYAKKHPNDSFAISGKSISGVIPTELQELKDMQNIILLGYISDSQVKSLMKNCKAFIFPSYYEGFGIPPLEALSVNAKVVVANSASLPEIYKNTVHYINYNDTNIELDDLLTNKIESPEIILKQYTYTNSAKKLLELLRNL